MRLASLAVPANDRAPAEISLPPGPGAFQAAEWQRSVSRVGMKRRTLSQLTWAAYSLVRS
jgi:hypothetical protein